MRPIPEPVAVVEAASEPEHVPEPEPEPAPEPVRKGRVSAALELFGKAFRTLFSGSDE
jgi:polyphosphate kinase